MLGSISHSTLPENVTRNLGEFYLGQARTEKEKCGKAMGCIGHASANAHLYRTYA